MRKVVSYRLKNPYMLLSVVMLFVTAVVCWVIGSPLLDFLKLGSDAKYLKEIEMTREMFNDKMMPSAFAWEMILIWGLRYMPFIFPIFPALTALRFVTEKKGYLANGALRFQEPRQQMRKVCLYYAVMGGLTITIPVGAYFSVMRLFPYTGAKMQTLGGFTDAFSGISYREHPYIILMIMACTIYFLFGFAFSLFACAVAMWKKQKALVLLLPLVLYTVLNYISSMFGGVLFLNMCEPVVAYSTLRSPLELCIPLCEIVVLSVVMIEGRFHMKRGWVVQ